MAIVIDPISPVAFSVFGLPIRWYALAYITAFIVGYYIFKYLSKRDDSQIYLSKRQLDDLLSLFILGVILGGRLGYVIFYNFHYFLYHPLHIFFVWEGGMSFHGGLLGAIAFVFLFARSQKFANKSVTRNSLQILDIISVIAPIGLGLGRIANFINMEVMGRETTSSWGVYFNDGENNLVCHSPEHACYPSPLYEAFFEGLVLFIIMWLLYNKTNLKKHPGALGSLLLVFYAIFRIFCEQFRQPDEQIGFLTSWGLTMGQMLSGLMLVTGLTIFVCILRKKKV